MDTHTNTTTSRPFGYWLRAVDRLLAREFETAFENEGITRREWRLLSLLDGDLDAPELTARLERHGGKKLRALTERGWISRTGDAWTLTDEGRAAKARLSESVDAIRAKVAASVSEQDFATTLASLEAIARSLGWEPAERMPRGFGPRGFGRSGFGPGRHGHGFGPFGPGEGFGPHREGFRPREGFGPGAHGARRHAERAFERGFEAGFARGRAEHGA